MAETPIILLAAGSSSRMGQLKQLLPWENQTLIEFQIEKLLQLGYPVYVVLGSSAEEILTLIKKYPVQVVINTDWEKGMGTSVAAGIKQVLTELPNAAAALYTVIDQPLITVNHLQSLIDSFSAGKEQIIASHSKSGWLGVPALYDAAYFSELISLTGEQGAKTIIKKHGQKVLSVDAGEMLKDMDTIESYRRLLTKYSSQNLSD